MINDASIEASMASAAAPSIVNRFEMFETDGEAIILVLGGVTSAIKSNENGQKPVVKARALPGAVINRSFALFLIEALCFKLNIGRKDIDAIMERVEANAGNR